MIKNNKVGSMQKFYSILITIAIIALLVFIVPVNALDVKLSPASSPKVKAGESVTFTAALNIKTNEQVPISSLNIRVGNQVCTFQVDGTPISGCDNIQITLTKFESDYLQADNTFKFKGTEYDYGYGYGYTSTKASGSADIEYNIQVTKNTGKYDVSLEAVVGSNEFKSVTHKFEVK